MEQLRLDGKVALVTGSGRGLGRTYALLLAARGAAVVVNDPGGSTLGEGADEGPAHDVADEIAAAGGRAVANFDSVATEAGARAMVAQALAAFGRLDIVVNNAGNFLPRHDFADSTNEGFASIWQVHVMGTVNVCRAAWPHFVGQRSGRIVNTASHVGYLGSASRPEYATAKGAIHGLTRALALEAAPHGIAVNAIAPAGLTRPNLEDAIPEIFSNGMFDPALVAPTLLWLVHDDCTANGAAFGAMAGTTTRILIAETHGFTSRNPTPEAIRDNFAVIMDEPTIAGSGLDVGTEGEQRGMELLSRYPAT